jgi:6-pyruvoyl-tetrahydropterin synthase
MYSITTEASFDAAHFLKNYNGKYTWSQMENNRGSAVGKFKN